MGFKCGIVGMPNVGKSALFNALTQTVAAQEANYLFSTVESNIGDVAVPDARLDKLAEIAKSAEIVPTRITFVDIAGLVKGASQGEGLGNKFLSHIRETDAIVNVVRCFDDDNVIHVVTAVVYMLIGLAAGLATSIGLQAWTIMAGNANLIPLTGGTLPFISYGGSSLLISFIAIGLLLHISADRD